MLNKCKEKIDESMNFDILKKINFIIYLLLLSFII